MSRLTEIVLSEQDRAALEKGYKQRKTHAFRQRCLMILLKADKKTPKQIGGQLGCCLVPVSLWVKRYQSEGIEGLHIKEGRGRPAILRKGSDFSAARAAVQVNRRRLSAAQETPQAELGKPFSPLTRKRFLGKTELPPIQADTEAGERRPWRGRACVQGSRFRATRATRRGSEDRSVLWRRERRVPVAPRPLFGETRLTCGGGSRMRKCLRRARAGRE
jgi:hypothetical protein